MENDKMILSDCGTIVRDTWFDLPSHYPNVVLDEYVIMPNHFHGILFLSTEGKSTVGAGYKPAQNSFSGRNKISGLSEVVRNFKTFSARHINRMRETPGVAFWQRNYFERIIRDDDELNRIRQYILDNPQNWQTDEPDENTPSPTSGSDWDAPTALIKITGTASMGDTAAAYINGDIKEVGDTVEVSYSGRIYQWKVKKINASGTVALDRVKISAGTTGFHPGDKK